MQQTDFDHAPDRRHTASIKWDRYGERDVLPLWIADMDFAVPAAVTSALQQRVTHAVFGYTHASTGLTKAFCEHVHHYFNWELRPDWLLWVPGAVPVLHAACRLIEPHHKVVTTTPIYPPFRLAPQNMERGHSAVALSSGHDGRPLRDIDAMARAFADDGRLWLLCNPHNPGGQVAERKELEALAERALRHDTLVVADELHADLVLDGTRKHIPFATLSPEIARRTITLMAPSKTFNIAGLGLACAIVPDPGLRRRIGQAMNGIVPYVNALAYSASEAAWRQGRDWHARLIDYLRGNRDLIAARLARMPCIKAYPPEATYLYWLDLRDSGCADPLGHLEAHGLGLSDGTEFGAPGFARLNFACPRATLATALDRLDRAFAGA